MQPPSEFVLADGNVHVWRASLVPKSDIISEFRALLSTDEIVRADRFHFEKHRVAFTVRRGILRQLLGKYLGRPPVTDTFPSNQYGKPGLPDSYSHSDIHFSISHSAGVGLFAFSRGRDLGVDIEAVRTDIEYCALSERFFSKLERQTLRSLPPDRQCEAFFACWSRKEAYIKARGMGLSMPLDQFDVTLAPHDPARLIATRDNPANAASWTMYNIDAGQEYAGALAVEGNVSRIYCFEWNGGTEEFSHDLAKEYKS